MLDIVKFNRVDQTCKNGIRRVFFIDHKITKDEKYLIKNTRCSTITHFGNL